MKINLGILIIVLCIAGCATTRNIYDKNGNPVFNSIEIGEEQIGSYIINSNYYTLWENINNPNSSVFISKKPNKEQIWKFCTQLPSYHWILANDKREMIKMIMLSENLQGFEPDWEWFITDVANNESKNFKTDFGGQMTEHRYLETTQPDSLLISVPIPKESGIIFTKNNQIYMVVPYAKIYDELKQMIEQYKLYDPKVRLSVIPDDAFKK